MRWKSSHIFKILLWILRGRLEICLSHILIGWVLCDECSEYEVIKVASTQGVRGLGPLHEYLFLISIVLKRKGEDFCVAGG